MKSLFIPLAIEYDPEDSTYKGTFKLTAKSVLNIMRSILEERKSDETQKITDVFMSLVQDKKVEDNLIMYFACYGVHELFKLYSDGISLVDEADNESPGD